MGRNNSFGEHQAAVLHFPFYITLGPSKILWHSILEILGFFIGFRYYVFLRTRQTDPINTANRLWILIGAIFGALIGSRLVGALENPPALMAAANPLLYIYTNKTVVGGFTGGLVGVELMKYAIKEKQSSGDLFTYPMILALIIGRAGCFSMGVYEETYGLPTKMFTGMNLGDGLLRHPVALYEMVFLALLWMALLLLEKKVQLVNGARFKLFMIAYLLFRFSIDFIKPHYTFSFGLSTIQITCVIFLAYYYKSIFNPRTLVLNPNHHA